MLKIKPESQFFDINYSQTVLPELEIVAKSGYCGGLSEYIEASEAQLRYFFNRPALCVTNGTLALELSLRAAGIKVGDYVGVSSRSFVASANAILMVGAIPVFIGMDQNGVSLCPDALEDAFDDYCLKALINVHLYGYPTSIQSIYSICSRYECVLIEDSAQAFGARFNQKLVGTFGAFATLSFFSNKIIACGEGGAILCADNDLFEELKIWRYHGAYIDPELGFLEMQMGTNGRLNAFSAALLNAQLIKNQFLLSKRSELWMVYQNFVEEEEIPVSFLQPYPQSEPVYWVAVFKKLNSQGWSFEAIQSLIKYFDSFGIASRSGFPQLSKLKFLKDFPNFGAVQNDERELLLPLHPGLDTDAIYRIIHVLKKIKIK